jgi:hypothetical protein
MAQLALLPLLVPVQAVLGSMANVDKEEIERRLRQELHAASKYLTKQRRVAQQKERT